MPYIKELIMKGFKSFANETKIVFDKGMNVIIGPNGSGKSNIADAICFVLGRLSMKSMRAERISNLIFSSPHSKPIYEASVKIIFDNSDKKIPLQTNEVSIERIIRRNGQSIYKINEEPKTRQEVLELLASFGIDPYGFNIILQDEITNVIRISGEERRKIIEEVSGISIYEQRKEKSLHELKKTEEKLRIVEAILRDRSAYLKNLEEERKQALKYKELENLIKKLKASILNKKIKEKERIKEDLTKKINDKESEREKIKKEIESAEKEISELEIEIQKLDSLIQKNTGIEQEKIYEEITELKSLLAGLEIKKKNYEEKIDDNNTKIEKIKEEITNLEKEVENLTKGLSEKEKLKKLEEKKENFYDLKLKHKVELEKLNQIKNIITIIEREENSLIKDIEKIEIDLNYKDKRECEKTLSQIKDEINSKEKILEKNRSDVLILEKEISYFSSEIKNLQKIKNEIKNLKGRCPLCHSEITPEHSQKIAQEAEEKIVELEKKIEENKQKLGKFSLEELEKEIEKLKEKQKIIEIEFIKLNNIEEKKNRLKELLKEKEEKRKELIEREKNVLNFEKKINEKKDVIEKYNRLVIEVQELSILEERDIDSDLKLKKREIDRLKNLIKESINENKNLQEEIEEIDRDISEKEKLLEDVEKKEEEFIRKNQELLNKKNNLQQKIYEKNKLIFNLQTSLSNLTNEINQLKIEKARIDAELENLINDFELYKNYEIIEGSLQSLQEKLENAQKKIEEIGEVNILALKRYEEVKKDYEKIAEKVEILRKEKESIQKIIEEIDRKKVRTFMKTLHKINELFNRNFIQLSQKGEALLKLENENDPFSGGLDIVIKVGKGKYFDVSSLSGGEKTLIAISLIFAIQEYKPYPFYIFDEIDAALDKRNSERLALLIKKYMKTGQYIIITHNDTIIEEAIVLYGVSMQDGKSKVFSIRI